MQTGTRASIEHEGIRPLEHAQGGVPEEDDDEVVDDPLEEEVVDDPQTIF